MTNKNFNKPIVLSIAGFDPTAGAGFIADIKTIENTGCYAMAVCTANTVQTDTNFLECHWIEIELMLLQLKTLLESYQIAAVKIGIVKNKHILKQILQVLKQYNNKLPIVLDPVLKASSGFDFHGETSIFSEDILTEISVITPNYEEINSFANGKSIAETITSLQKHTHVLLKGGHHPSKKGTDILFMKDTSVCIFSPSEVKIYEKHGSGCILSAAIASYLAQGKTLEEACENAKMYIEKTLQSNTTKLAYHS
ncbi:hydroxymethylpyrimidine/phosphomethylpyrimidine kinase [Joostella sp. CR20]|uniref:hydroxymethylpyrimidine/phosphomethylpyrimidine kinase n=1 Tax=Joostella sp. CR20 TaxID=2804312 RepID=UPI00313E8EE6